MHYGVDIWDIVMRHTIFRKYFQSFSRFFLGFFFQNAGLSPFWCPSLTLKISINVSCRHDVVMKRSTKQIEVKQKKKQNGKIKILSQKCSAIHKSLSINSKQKWNTKLTKILVNFNPFQTIQSAKSIYNTQSMLCIWLLKLQMQEVSIRSRKINKPFYRHFTRTSAAVEAVKKNYQKKKNNRKLSLINSLKRFTSFFLFQFFSLR